MCCGSLADLIDKRRDHFARLIAQEGGKPMADAIVETTRAIDGVRNAADELRNFAGREIPMGLTPASTGRLAFTTREPIGVVAAISAFNHPLNLIVHQVAPAIAVGCPVIVKPATATPLCCIEFVSLVREAGLAEPWCQTFITPDNALAERLATDPRVAFLSFIGSARVGWHLHSKLAPGTRSALEHGGAAPAIVDRSANLDALIEPMVKGGYYHAGQVCVSTQRIYVHSTLMPAFRRTLRRARARAARRRSAVAGDRSRSADQSARSRPRRVVGGRSGRSRSARSWSAASACRRRRWSRRCCSSHRRTRACRARRCSAP